MKKFILMMALTLGFVSANAQTATEDSKFVDNTYLTVNAGLATPLALDAVFPLNTTLGIALGKWITPEYGVEIEGTTWLGSHIYGGTDARANMNANGNFNAFRGLYVGANGLLNVTNIFKGYQGAPRTFETNALVGIGWVHGFTPNTNDRYNNSLGAKTGLDFAFNLGKTKASTLSIRPAVLWDLSKPGTSVGSLAFNKHGAQLYLGVGYTYHFKNSNGLRYHKTYDVGAMQNEIALLNEKLAKGHHPHGGAPKVIEREKVIERTMFVPNEWVVQFAQGDAQLSSEAKAILDGIGNNIVVDVIGTASPEGDGEANQKLSERRAAAVADYLKQRGVRVNSTVGKGVQIGKFTNRLSIITVTR